MAKKYGLPVKQFQKALEEGERAWDSTRRDNLEDQENMERIRRILQQIRDYQRGKQKTLNADVRDLITWHQTYFREGDRQPTEAEAIEGIKGIFSRPSGTRQMSIYNLDLDLEALRKFSWPLRDLWIRLGKRWTVTNNASKRKNKHSQAENFFLACASHLEPELSHVHVRSVIMRPFAYKDEEVDDPSDYNGMAMVLTKHGPAINKISKNS